MDNRLETYLRDLVFFFFFLSFINDYYLKFNLSLVMLLFIETFFRNSQYFSRKIEKLNTFSVSKMLKFFFRNT